MSAMDPVDRLIAASGLASASRPVVATAWHAMLDAARAAWPDVRIDPAQVVDFVARRSRRSFATPGRGRSRP